MKTSFFTLEIIQLLNEKFPKPAIAIWEKTPEEEKISKEFPPHIVSLFVRGVDSVRLNSPNGWHGQYYSAPVGFVSFVKNLLQADELTARANLNTVPAAQKSRAAL